MLQELVPRRWCPALHCSQELLPAMWGGWEWIVCNCSVLEASEGVCAGESSELWAVLWPTREAPWVSFLRLSHPPLVAPWQAQALEVGEGVWLLLSGFWQSFLPKVSPLFWTCPFHYLRISPSPLELTLSRNVTLCSLVFFCSNLCMVMVEPK